MTLHTTNHIVSLSADEMFETTTGFEEIAVHKAFGMRLADFADVDPMGFLRALVFVHRTREGDNANEAKRAALSMTVREVTNYFEPPVEEPMPEEPATDQGKDDSLDD